MESDKIRNAPARVKALISALAQMFQMVGVAPSEARQALTLIVEWIDDNRVVEREMAAKAMSRDDDGKLPN